nr:MAG: hypothetical protein J07AB56_01640 [Candidatus Nanosalinarum sp. J07AB56]
MNRRAYFGEGRTEAAFNVGGVEQVTSGCAGGHAEVVCNECGTRPGHLLKDGSEHSQKVLHKRHNSEFRSRRIMNQFQAIEKELHRIEELYERLVPEPRTTDVSI